MMDSLPGELNEDEDNNSDNVSSVVFAFLMAMKRYSYGIRYRWGDVKQMAPETEHSLPQYLFRRVKKLDKKLQFKHPMRPSFWRRRLPVNVTSWTGVLFLVLIAWVVYASIVVFRTSMVVVLAWAHDDFLHKPHTTVASWSASCINAVVVLSLNFDYDRVALWFTKLEWQKDLTDLALINNIVDLRLTASKFLTCYQRPIPQKVQNIGVWFSMTLTKVADAVDHLLH